MKEFYKILHENQKHFGMQYHLGLNEDVEPFDEKPYCGIGGIFFADKEQVLEYLTYAQGTKLAIIEIPEGEQIIQIDNVYKAHRINIKEIKDLWTDENYEWLTSYFGIDNLFLYACKNGALSFAKELEKYHKIDIHKNNEYTFRLACSFGQLEVAKWLYNLGGVDIHAEDDDASLYACANGYSDVVKWLHSLDDVDSHADDNYVFKDSPEEIINWLDTFRFFQEKELSL